MQLRQVLAFPPNLSRTVTEKPSFAMPVGWNSCVLDVAAFIQRKEPFARETYSRYRSRR